MLAVGRAGWNGHVRVPRYRCALVLWQLDEAISDWLNAICRAENPPVALLVARLASTCRITKILRLWHGRSVRTPGFTV